MQSIYHSFDEAGTDEAGRGSLAGPVTAAAVVLPSDFHHSSLNDSKLLSEKTRQRLRVIIEREAISFCVSHISAQQIDHINILNASILAMHESLRGLSCNFSFIIVDGNRFLPFGNIPYKTIVKGDSLFTRIAAASVLAKTHRDELMQELSLSYPQYRWDKNKGYPTAEHRRAILDYGLSPYHRKTFRQLPLQLDLGI